MVETPFSRIVILFLNDISSVPLSAVVHKLLSLLSEAIFSDLVNGGVVSFRPFNEMLQGEVDD